MKVSKRDLQILMAFGGILLAFCTYYFLFLDLQPKTDNLKQQNKALDVQIARLVQLDTQRETYKNDTAVMQEETEQIIATYAYGLSREDEIMYMAQLEHENSSNMEIHNMNMSTPEEVTLIKEGVTLPDGTQIPTSPETTDGVLTDGVQAGEAVTKTEAEASYGEPVIEDNGIKLYKEAINYNFTSTYTGLKDILNTIYGMGSHKSIDSLKLVFDSTTGNLAAEMQLCMYYLEGTQNEYVPLEITPMSTGIGNIFGTVDVMASDGTQDPGATDNAEAAAE